MPAPKLIAWAPTRPTSKRSGSGKTRGVAVGSPEHGHDLFAGLDLDAVDIDRFRRGPAVELHRAVPPQQLLDARTQQAPVVAQPLELRGVVEQGKQTVADEVRRGLESGREEQDHGGDQLIVAELVALLLDVDELGEQVVGRMRTPLGNQHLEAIGDAPTRFRRSLDLFQCRCELECRHRRAHERLEIGAVRLRDAEHLADDGDRQLQCELRDDVDGAVDAIEQLVREAKDVRP